MDRLFTKILIFASIWNLILPANLFASNKAIVITPVMDGKSDNISKDLSKSFSDFFIKKGFQVVSNEKVNAILDYYRLDREAKDKSEATKNIEDSIIKAKEHYYNFEYAEAGAQIKYAIEQLEKGDADNGRLLRDAYIIAGMITKSGKKKEGETSFFFKKALTLDPGYQLDEKNFSPSVVDVFNEVKSEQLKLSSGTIRIESDPKVAEVFINGIFKGVTPIEVSGLPEGPYKVSVKTNKYNTIQREVRIISNRTTKLREKLVWNGNNSRSDLGETSERDARSEIAEGVRIADILKVPKAIFVDVDEGDAGGEITLRMIDRKYRAGYKPVNISYNKSKDRLARKLEDATALLIEQANADLTKDPIKYLDPDGIGDPALLKTKKKPLFAVPAFWAIVGGVVAAGAGGVAVATLGGGHPPVAETGSINVQFK